ncbi:MAG: hypothetical protein ACREQ7_02525 [Candidatus Binatia bacterium]
MAIALLTGSCLVAFPVFASRHYTEKQIDALATRVGKIYWVVPVDGKLPAFFSAPAAQARSFRPQKNEFFEITELVGRQAKNPYYKIKFESGKDGYLRAETFLEEFNSTIVSVDPLADEKKKAAEQEAEERKRLEWIENQPWSKEVKQAAIKHQAVTGMTSAEVRKILGQPIRTDKVKRPQSRIEEHWLYQDGSVLVFHQGILSHIKPKSARK